MTHKAFLFDHASFARELESILVTALATEAPGPVRGFVIQNLAALRDPNEGVPLDADWEEALECRDVHAYGDVALTKFYDPADDVGLGENWDAVQSVVAADPALDWSPILGVVIGSMDNPFDPGKMGSYVQSSSQVRASRALLQRLAAAAAGLDAALAMLSAASHNDLGLYVTF